MAEKELRALGIISGIGSMLIGAEQAGFKVVGNIEDRKYYHTGTFEKNFEGAFMVNEMEDLDEVPQDIALIMGHADCGDFSNLNAHRKKTVLEGKGCRHIIKTVELTQAVQPRFFAFDNLPRSLEEFGADEYKAAFPDYDIYFEWISNWAYGNVQKNRDRLFVIGAKKEEKFVFKPGERFNYATVRDMIGDLKKDGSVLNDHGFSMDYKIAYFKDLVVRGESPTLQEFVDKFKDHKQGKNFEYINKDGEVKCRIGLMKTKWEGTGHVLTKELPILHPKTCLPLNVRDRARIQGVPDDFEFVGEVLDENGNLDYHKSIKLMYQTGKCMPVQFNNFLASQIMAHIRGEEFDASGARLLKQNEIVDQHKIRMCEIDYHPRKCEFCWVKDKCPRQVSADFFTE